MEALAATGGLGRSALHSQLAAAVQLVLHMRRDRGGARVFDAAGVLHRNDSGEVRVLPVWTRRDGWSAERSALGELLAERGVRVPW
jgi:pilus assembly protein CpaF